MTKNKFILLFFGIVGFITIHSNVFAQFEQTVGLLEHKPGSLDEGYVLFSPMNDTCSYLIDKCGFVVQKWHSKYWPGLSAYLLPNGKLLRSGRDLNSIFASAGGGGIIQLLDWDSNIEWEVKLSNEKECQHHDIFPLPNGNVLAIVWEKKTKAEAIAAGRDTATLKNEIWSEKIIELKPIGKDSAEIVWEWKIWDHLVQEYDKTKENYASVSEHPERININYYYSGALIDWHHLNSIDYNEEFDQILISSRHFSEIWIIDHSTTTEEAKQHNGGKYAKGGDLLYRWGNPMTYNKGNLIDRDFVFQHNAHWIKKGLKNEGMIMVFNNLRGPQTAKYSTIDIINPPVNKNGYYEQSLPFGPDTLEWSYSAENPRDFLGMNLSGAETLGNGNILICNGSEGKFFEIDTNKKTVWKYVNPITDEGILPQGVTPSLTNNVFRCSFYPYDYSAFNNKNLYRKGIIENRNTLSDTCNLFVSVTENQGDNFSIFPNPANSIIYINSKVEDYSVEIYDLSGNLIFKKDNISEIDISKFPSNYYNAIISTKSNKEINYIKILIIR